MLFRVKQTNMSPSPNVSYFKTVLSKVYVYPSLFAKELLKARHYLSSYDYKKLKIWSRKLEKSKIT